MGFLVEADHHVVETAHDQQGWGGNPVQGFFSGKVGAAAAGNHGGDFPAFFRSSL